jgi:alpha-1,6-mannosyltransferase
VHIVQLANFYSATSGGLRVAVDELRAGYQAAGSHCTLIIPGSQSRTRRDVVEIASPKLPNGTGYRIITSRHAVLAALDRASPDVIEVHDKLLQRWVWQWARDHGVPLIAVSHERLDATLAQFLPRLPAPLRQRLAGFVAGRAVAECDLLVVCSAFAASEFGSSPKVERVPLGVDLQRFKPTLGLARSGPVKLISVGRLSAEKRPDIAIGTLKELHRRGISAELTLLGAGPWESRLRKQATGLPVSFAGFVRGADSVAGRLASADIALAPGPAETFGLAALEALACGTSIVTVTGAATSELVSERNEAGRAADPHDTAFADAVCELLAEPLTQRRAAARAVAERYSWAHTVASMQAIHARLVPQKRLVLRNYDASDGPWA